MHFRSVTSAAWDVERRAEEMAPYGVDRQVLSPMPELFCYWADGGSAATYTAEMNAWLAGQVRASGGRFDGFGIVPMQEPEQAALMLADVAALGLRGVQVGSNVAGVPLHDARFAPFFAEAERLGLAVFVHAFHPHGFETITGGPAASGVTFPNEIGFAAAGLVAEGVLYRHPACGSAPATARARSASACPRMDRMWEFDPGFRERLPERPSDLARRLFVDLLVFAPWALQFVLDVLGVDRVVVGSDYPFMPDAPGAVLEHLTNLEPRRARAHHRRERPHAAR